VCRDLWFEFLVVVLVGWLSCCFVFVIIARTPCSLFLNLIENVVDELLTLINVSVLCSVILFFVLDLFWGLDAVHRLLLCFRICYFFCSLVFVLKFSLFILMCGLNS
jgi:hypothetical protein